jgi:dTDP-4-dehydrorhamnose reductase
MSRRALIIGSSGLVAPALSKRLRQEGWQVLTTSRTGNAGIRFDLARPEMSVLPADVDAVFVIAAETSLRRCEDGPDDTRTVNVETPAEIAHFYAGKGAHLLTISSNLVFDGTVPGATALSARRPACAYGRQKSELEDAFLSSSASATVLRITKIVESLEKLATAWSADLAAGRPIRPFLDLVCAPVSLARVIDILVHAAEKRSTGLFQHSGDRDIDYAEIARTLCRKMKLSETLIEPVHGADLPEPPVVRPLHTTLAETLPAGFAPQNAENVVTALDGFFARRRADG